MLLPCVSCNCARTEIYLIPISWIEQLCRSNTMNSKNQLSVHPLDAAYALAFFLLLIYYVAGVSSIVIQPPVRAELLWWDRFYLVLVALILTAQLLRMYYHLKYFEVGIASPGKSHFLELLPAI